MEHWNHTLAERLFGHQYAVELAVKPRTLNLEWVAFSCCAGTQW